MNFNAFIFARGGSKGLPRKNILKIDNVPLLGHSINHARSISTIKNIFVSTDDDEIAAVGKEYGAKIIKRPSSLSQDNSPEWLAWKHAIKYVFDNYGEFDGFISLPCTSPLRSEEDTNKCISKLYENFDIVITISDSKRSPWFNIVQNGESNNIVLLKTFKENTITRRQDVPKTFDITTLAYASTTKFILNSSSIWDGNVGGVLIPQERSIDIDTKIDFEIAKFLYKKF